MSRGTEAKDKKRGPQDGMMARKSIVLLCCGLFLGILALHRLALLSGPLPGEARLLVSKELSMTLVPLTELPYFQEPPSLDSSRKTYRLAPFFFQPVAINYGDQSFLMSVPGIGPVLAQEILKSREGNGSFTGPLDLLRVKGIGLIRLQKFAPYFSFVTSYAQE